MQCPACHTALGPIDADGIKLDECPACSGLWLDAGELDALFGRRGMAVSGRDTPPGLIAVVVDRNAPKRTCPRCEGTLSRHAYQPRSHYNESLAIRDRGVVVDRCRTCAGLWFDKEELDTIAQASGVKGGLFSPRGVCGPSASNSLFGFVSSIWS